MFATVKVVVPAVVVVEVQAGVKLLAVTLEFESLKTTELAPLDVVTPVPPFATFKVPANVTAPVVPVDGVNPVVPALNVLTKLPLNADVGIVVDALTALEPLPYKYPVNPLVIKVDSVADPPVMATELAFCVDIVPKPEISVFGMVALAVNALVPLPLTYPVSVIAPVPPLATDMVVPFQVPAVIVPTPVIPV